MAASSNSHNTTITSAFLITRHGARQAINVPNHNIHWPSHKHKDYWESEAGMLTPLGVIQLYNLGAFFRKRYPWVSVNNVTCFSTARSRTLNSCWSLCLGLLPNTPIKFLSLKYDDHCSGNLCCDKDVCCIKYFIKGKDPLFGNPTEMNKDYKVNINKSPYLTSLVDDPVAIGLINRLSKNGHFKIKRDSVTTIAKLKDIYGQIQVDNQLYIPSTSSLIAHYGITDAELDIINKVGAEVGCLRSIPYTNKLSDRGYNMEQGGGILSYIKNKLQQQPIANSFTELSCHDTTLISLAANLGIRLCPIPRFAAYVLIERKTVYNDSMMISDDVDFYYVSDPFDDEHTYASKTWPPLNRRDEYIAWSSQLLTPGTFTTADFLRVLPADLPPIPDI